jgi:hypothetical protein
MLRPDAEQLGAEMLAWVQEADGIQGLRAKGVPPHVVELVRLKTAINSEIEVLEGQERRLWLRLIEALEAL